jgi:hypothetical protein
LGKAFSGGLNTKVYTQLVAQATALRQSILVEATAEMQGLPLAWP